MRWSDSKDKTQHDSNILSHVHTRKMRVARVNACGAVYGSHTSPSLARESLLLASETPLLDKKTTNVQVFRVKNDGWSSHFVKKFII